MTPEKVLKASGHVDRFTDFMVRDVVTQDCYRADHLLKDALEAVQADKAQTLERKEVCPDLARCNGCIVKESLSVCLQPQHHSSHLVLVWLESDLRSPLCLIHTAPAVTRSVSPNTAA